VLRALVLILAAGLVLPGAGTTQEPGRADPRLPSVELPAELQRVLSAYEDAWEAGDGAALAALFTEDGVIRRGNWIRGRAAIQARYDRIAQGDLRLRALDYGAAGETGYLVGAYAYPPDIRQDRGVFVLALRRAEDGRWLIAADLDHGI
jgi:ketosteroid isomerase-like protein